MNLWKTATGVSLFLLLAFLSGCARQDQKVVTAGATSAQPPRLAAESIDAELRARIEAAKDELAQRLLSELMQAMQSEGPGKGIKICSQLAPEIAQQVSEQHGLQIGRTSFRLRNPKNAPPDWAKELISENNFEAGFYDLSDGKVGAMFPIKLVSMCTLCHGQRDQLMDEVKTQLAMLYPDDQATGFLEGDLRGWFWVNN